MVELADTIFRDFVTDGVPSSGVHKPQKSKIREWGTWLESRQTGTGMLYAFSSITADADPGTGTFRLNNAVPASATALYIDDLDASGANVGGIINLWDDSTNTVKGLLAFRGVDDPEVLLIYSVTGTVVDGTGYRKVTLTYAGGGGTPGNGDEFVVTFDRAGDVGGVASVAGLTGAISDVDLRNATDTPVYISTLAALRALDTTKDITAIVNQEGYEGTYKWDGSNLSGGRMVLQTRTTTSVNSATDTITLVAHGLHTGNGLLVTTAVNGLAVNTLYWAIKVDADNFKLASSLANALAGTPAFDVTGTTNFTFKQLSDPDQRVYVIKAGGQLDGSTGAWVRSDGAIGAGYTAFRFHRFNDRLLVGPGATRWLGEQVGTLGYSGDGAGSWLKDEVGVGGTAPMSYLLIGATLAAVSDGTNTSSPTGIVGATKTGAGANSGQAVGIAGFASGHATSGASVIWGAYIEAVKTAGSNTTTQGMELEVTNLNSTPVNPVVSPEAVYVQGRTFGLFMATGGGPLTNPTSYDADGAIFIGSNTAKWRTGLTFFSGALTKDAVTNYQHAILLPTKARAEWFTSDGLGNVGFSIHGEVSDDAHRQHLIVSDSGFNISNVSGKRQFGVLWTANAVNCLSVQPGATGVQPALIASGDDASIDVMIRGKGNGGGALQDGSSNSRMSWNINGVGFYGTAPVTARAGWSVDTGTAKRTANATFSGTASAAYVQAEMTAVMNALRDATQTIKAIKDDFHQTAGYGLLRT